MEVLWGVATFAPVWLRVMALTGCNDVRLRT